MKEIDKKDLPINVAYQYLRSKGVVHTQQDVADKMNVSKENVSRAFNGNEKYLTPSFLSSFNKAFDLIFVQKWLETGEEPMLRSLFTNEIEKKEIKEQMQLSKKRIPFYDDVATVGGTNYLIANDDSQCTPAEWIDAGDWFPEATAAIRHYGDSMVEYPSGSILALKRVEDHRLIIWGRNYSIETTEFRITKRLQDGGDDFIMAYSSNESTYSDGTLIHSPIKIPKETIRHIDLVLGCVTKEYSNGPIRIIKNNN